MSFFCVFFLAKFRLKRNNKIEKKNKRKKKREIHFRNEIISICLFYRNFMF